ncbi:MAG: hypothetical protein ABSE91_00935 [Patescibacteria group bacterium]|jgi:uncharacterized membrane protein YeaQ/YmgE (transglycosylase-associated protein family)
MQKLFIGVGMIVGSFVGGYLPLIFGVSSLSITSVLTGTVGALLGVYIGYKIGQNY